MPIKPMHRALLLVLALALSSHALAQPNPDPSGSAADGSAVPAPLASSPAPLAVAPPVPRAWLKAVYEQVVESVVLIETESGTGSGFFFHSPRLIATALHVVDDADTIVVETSNGRRQEGRVVAYSRKYDLV